MPWDSARWAYQESRKNFRNFRPPEGLEAPKRKHLPPKSLSTLATIVADFGDNLSPKTVALFCDSRRFWYPTSRKFFDRKCYFSHISPKFKLIGLKKFGGSYPLPRGAIPLHFYILNSGWLGANASGTSGELGGGLSGNSVATSLHAECSL